MKIKAVMFDLDGTLLNTLEDITDSMNTVIEREGFQTHSTEAYKYFIGDGVEAMVRRALPSNQQEETMIAKLMKRYRTEYHKNWSNKTKPYDGITDLLEALEEKGLRLAILSNKPDEPTKLMVSHYFSNQKFDVVQGAKSDMPRKPDPKAALEIASRLSIETDQFFYLGDTATDMKTAVAAGMYPVGVSWGFRTQEELRGNGAKLIIDKPTDLLRHFH
ncbi:MAG: HAD family hydrolase [Deltaproteobacteria bacterium]|nr:HAD family hydrolase [Deltaproteobacteria bacterium]